MASPVLVDFASLTLPVPGDEAAGTPVPLTVQQQLNAARKDTEPHPDDPTQGDIPRKVDWARLIETTSHLLPNKPRDRLRAARMTEALTREHGFAGLRDGLQLLRELVEQCWDRLHPIPEEGEGLEVRAAPFHWLTDADRGARFPTTVREVPMVAVNSTRLSWLDRKRCQDGKGPVAKDELERALPATPEDAEDLVQAVEQPDRLEQVLNDRFQENAPALMGVREVLEECQQVMQQAVKLQGPVGGDTTADGSPAEGADGAAGAAGSRA